MVFVVVSKGVIVRIIGVMVGDEERVGAMVAAGERELIIKVGDGIIGVTISWQATSIDIVKPQSRKLQKIL